MKWILFEVESDATRKPRWKLGYEGTIAIRNAPDLAPEQVRVIKEEYVEELDAEAAAFIAGTPPPTG